MQTEEKVLETLQKTYDRWTTGFCMSYAILEDYAEQLSKLTNESVDTIQKRVLEKAESNAEKVKNDSDNYF